MHRMQPECSHPWHWQELLPPAPRCGKLRVPQPAHWIAQGYSTRRQLRKRDLRYTGCERSHRAVATHVAACDPAIDPVALRVQPVVQTDGSPPPALTGGAGSFFAAPQERLWLPVTSMSC